MKKKKVKKTSSKQDKIGSGSIKPGEVRNPTGKGGFQDHPGNRTTNGRPKNFESIKYWLGYFNSLSTKNFLEYKSKHEHEMSMAALGAYARVGNMIKELPDFREVANRTDGTPTEHIENSGEVTIVIKHAIPDIKDERDID